MGGAGAWPWWRQWGREGAGCHPNPPQTLLINKRLYLPFNLHLSCFIVHLHLIKLFKSARFKLSHRCLYLGDFFEMVMNTISWAVSCPQMFQARRTLDPNRSCFASLSRFRDGAQAWSSESHPVRAHQAHPTLVRPPLAPNSLRHRGITSKNTFHAGRRDAITSRFKLIFPHGRPGFAAMDTLYGRLLKQLSRGSRRMSMSIMYSIHGHPFAYSSRATYFQHVHSGIQTKHFNELIQLASVEFCDS